jgi:hypothetical protein
MCGLLEAQFLHVACHLLLKDLSMKSVWKQSTRHLVAANLSHVRLDVLLHVDERLVHVHPNA